MDAIPTIDWNEAWKQRQAQRSSRGRNSSFWNRRAPAFADNASRTGYAEAFIKIIKPQRNWTVLDMGCGGGTLAIPLSPRVKKIIAVDYSEAMLDILAKQATRAGIRNIEIIREHWENDWSAAGIGISDVAIASRSLVVEDLRQGILKLDGAARKRVYVSTIVGDGPYDRRIFDALGRRLDMGPDYIYPYNLLYQMGIHAKIEFIVEKNARTYRDHDEAFESLKWMFNEMTLTEEKALKLYLDKHLIGVNSGRVALNYDKIVKWAVIWWEINQSSPESDRHVPRQGAQYKKTTLPGSSALQGGEIHSPDEAR